MAERRPAADTDAADAEVAEEPRRLSAAEAAQEGLEQIAELIGKDPESVTGVMRSKGGWLITVEMLEDRRIPSSTGNLTWRRQPSADFGGEILVDTILYFDPTPHRAQA